MHDLRDIRTHPDTYRTLFQRRDCAHIVDEILTLDLQNRQLITDTQTLQTRRNDLSKQIGALMKAKKADAAEAIKQEVADIKDKMQEIEVQQGVIAEKLHGILMSYPNILADDVPEGDNEDANQEIKKHGEVPDFSFTPKPHDTLGDKNKAMDFEQAAKISGSRFVYLRNDLALLERALASFMLDIHTKEFGYTEVSPPVLVWDKALVGTGQLPKFKEDLFVTTAAHSLIPTAEVSLTNYVREKIMSEEELPIRMTAHTLCFRSEAGSAGQDTKGMIRQHQFSKVELVSIVPPALSDIEQARMVGCAETILERLGLAYRRMLLCSGDTGFGAVRTYDIEVWIPSQNCYREISSVSNCGAFQARRMNARYKDSDGKNHFVHTLNGSALAVGRTIVALLENYQNEDGSVTIPEALRPYMHGKEVIL